MKQFYSQSTGIFYHDDLYKEGQRPKDCVPVSDETHAALMVAQAEGKRIVADKDGYPVLADPPPLSPSDAIKAQIAALETQQTPRRVREASLGTDGGWLACLEAQIEDLRAQL